MTVVMPASLACGHVYCWPCAEVLVATEKPCHECAAPVAGEPLRWDGATARVWEQSSRRATERGDVAYARRANAAAAMLEASQLLEAALAAQLEAKGPAQAAGDGGEALAFLDVAKPWSLTEKERFRAGLDPWKSAGRARRFYCASVGLTWSHVRDASDAKLAIMNANTGTKNRDDLFKLLRGSDDYKLLHLSPHGGSPSTSVVS